MSWHLREAGRLICCYFPASLSLWYFILFFLLSLSAVFVNLYYGFFGAVTVFCFVLYLIKYDLFFLGHLSTVVVQIIRMLH